MVWGARPLVLVVFVAAWILYVEIGRLPSYFLPHPFAVAGKFAELALNGTLLKHARATVTEAVLGFALGSAAAICIGTLISRSRLLELTLKPYIVASQTTPIVVLAPLFLVWFGFGLLSKILIAAIICFFPLLVNVMAGLGSVGEQERQLFRSLEASAWQTFVRLEIPPGCASPACFPLSGPSWASSSEPMRGWATSPSRPPATSKPR